MAKFEKGKSGNPGGRPKESDEIKALAREYTKESVLKLAEWMRSDDAKASVAACNSLLDRAWGKPSQAVDVTGTLEVITELNVIRKDRG